MFSLLKTLLPEPLVVSIGDYATSEFLRRRKNRRVLLLEDRQWTADQLEGEFLAPLFRDARTVKLVDRLIGQKILPRDAATAPPITCAMPQNYRCTLDWITKVFARESTCAQKIFEIYTSVDISYMDKNHLSALKKAANAFIDEVESSTGLRPSISFRAETNQVHMPHGRYLITDRIGFLVERGFDLLWSDAQMVAAKLDPLTSKRPIRDVMISLCPYTERVEGSVSRCKESWKAS